MSRRARRQFNEGPEAAKQFEDALGKVLSVSKEELDKRESEYQESIKDRTRRGPKPNKK